MENYFENGIETKNYLSSANGPLLFDYLFKQLALKGSIIYEFLRSLCTLLSGCVKSIAEIVQED
jgi:hypothetical protein